MQLFRTLFNIILKNIFITNFPFLADLKFFVNPSLKPRSPYFLLNKNLNFDKSKTESKMENPRKSFREVMNHGLQLIQESRIWFFFYYFCFFSIVYWIKVLDYKIFEEVMNSKLKRNFLSLVQVIPRVQSALIFWYIKWFSIYLQQLAMLLVYLWMLLTTNYHISSKSTVLSRRFPFSQGSSCPSIYS